jgi:hypothetical protein
VPGGNDSRAGTATLKESECALKLASSLRDSRRQALSRAVADLYRHLLLARTSADTIEPAHFTWRISAGRSARRRTRPLPRGTAGSWHLPAAPDWPNRNACQGFTSINSSAAMSAMAGGTFGAGGCQQAGFAVPIVSLEAVIDQPVDGRPDLSPPIVPFGKQRIVAADVG